MRAASYEEEAECEAAMYQAISELAVPNRDTLAYIILHLKSVADHKDKNKMDMDNLSKVMGKKIYITISTFTSVWSGIRKII